MVGTLTVLDTKPGTKYQWDTDDALSVERVTAIFNTIVKENKGLGYTVSGDGQDEVIRDFDPEAAPHVYVSPQLAGG